MNKEIKITPAISVVPLSRPQRKNRDENVIIPATLKGRSHLEFLTMAQNEVGRTTHEVLDKYDDALEVIGISMCIFYQAATCY